MTGSSDCQDLELPALWGSVDRASAESQSLFYRLKMLELGALVVGATGALMPTAFAGGAGPAASLLAFLLVIVLHASRSGARAESRWYDARAAAESIKSAAWQYAVGGEAFRIDDVEADARFTARLKDVLANVPKLDIGAGSTFGGSVTAGMRALRAMSQGEREAVYRQLRVEDQVSWYANKSRHNRNRARLFNVVMIAVETLAVVTGLVRFRGGLDIDLLGLLAAVSAALIAWTQAKKYTLLAESYAVTSHEINILAATVSSGVTEDAWAQSIHDAEAAFSREHTMWQARRQGPA